MKEDNFEKFIEEREKEIILEEREKIGADKEPPLPTMTTPYTPYTNIRIIRNVIESCRRYVYWVDKYFDISGIDILISGIAKTDIREVKILISLNNADDNMRSNFRRFKEEMENKDIMCEMRVIVDPKIYREDHDRWILSSNINYNLMSPSIAKRGQYSERKETKNRPPFDDWWKNSLEIFSNWDDICKYRESLNK